MKQLHRNYTGSPQFPSDQCWICEKDSAENERVLDHCHASGKFLGFSHSKYNLKRRTVNYIPIIAHNVSNYDLNFICKHLHLFPEDSKIQVIPITDENTFRFRLTLELRLGPTVEELKNMSMNIYVLSTLLDLWPRLWTNL